jgi:hypothetical protein
MWIPKKILCLVVGLVFSLSVAGKVSQEALLKTERIQVERIAESYVKLVLAVGQHDSEYVDSYYGPPEWQKKAATRKMPIGEIRQQVLLAREELAAINPSKLDEMEKLRLRCLGKQLDSVKARIDMLSGVKMKFDEESAVLLGAIAPDYADSHFETKLAQLETMLPGEGSLRDRFSKFRERSTVPKEKVAAVFQAAMQEARLRTRNHIQLPAEENVRIQFVSDKPWTAFSQGLGNGQSLVQLNIDVPYTVYYLLLLACHEGYPGHHVSTMLFENRLMKKRGWREFGIVPLPSPLSLLMEGTANYALELAFPLPERIAFACDVLYPLAGLDPALAEKAVPIFAVTEPLSDPWLSEASPVAARRYLDGLMGRSAMLGWFEKCTLVPPDKLELIAQFIPRYRSYIICYTVGLDLVKRQIEKFAGADQEKRWQEFERLQTPPRPPFDTQ